MTTTIEQADPDLAAVPAVSFDTDPASYRHWTLDVDGSADTGVAYLRLDIDESAGIVPGYELKMNSYDLGVDIELYDATQRLRSSTRGRAVVITSARTATSCAGANIRMLAQSSSVEGDFWQVTNETRNGIEDATAHSGRSTSPPSTHGAGGLRDGAGVRGDPALDETRPRLSLPEVPLLGVRPAPAASPRDRQAPGAQGPRRVFATKSEGLRGKQAVEWRLVDEVIPKRAWDETVAERAAAAAARSDRPGDARGISLTPLQREETADGITYRHVKAVFDRAQGLVEITVQGPEGDVSDTVERVHELGADFWPLAMTRELDDLVRGCGPTSWSSARGFIRKTGDVEDRAGLRGASSPTTRAATGWSTRSALLRPHSQRLASPALADRTDRARLLLRGGPLELALACDRQYMSTASWRRTRRRASRRRSCSRRATSAPSRGATGSRGSARASTAALTTRGTTSPSSARRRPPDRGVEAMERASSPTPRRTIDWETRSGSARERAPRCPPTP